MRREFSPPPAPARAGSVLGDYELREEIGHGAMGVVHRAFDRLKREVAVKIVRPGAALSAEERAHFRFEAEAMAGLNHPNVVSVYAYGEANGEPYFAMELLPRSLGEWLESLGPDRCLRPTRAAELVRDIALGVHHAHQRGLIHRDLKPANVLLNEAGVPKVADFGLARRTDKTAMTFGGTPLYMAPEMVKGERLTTAVDVYALGVMLFELLTGHTPFGGGNKESVFKRILEAPTPGVRSLRPDIDRDLEAICLKCLSKDPDDRYPSAQALADDLERFLKGEGGIDRRSPVWRTVLRLLDRRKETLAMESWRVTFWGAASTAFALAVMQAAVLLNAPLWVSQAAVAYYLLAWLGLMWYFLVAPGFAQPR